MNRYESTLGARKSRLTSLALMLRKVNKNRFNFNYYEAYRAFQRPGGELCEVPATLPAGHYTLPGTGSRFDAGKRSSRYRRRHRYLFTAFPGIW
jgi:hypothetical protein